MKKILAFILCVVYVTASSGATINFHYCMGKFIGWDVTAPAHITCSSCSMHKEKAKGCCNDKHATLQLKKDQLASNINVVQNCNFIYVTHQNSANVISLQVLNNYITKSINSPPLVQTVPHFISNCVFRI